MKQGKKDKAQLQHLSIFTSKYCTLETLYNKLSVAIKIIEENHKPEKGWREVSLL